MSEKVNLGFNPKLVDVREMAGDLGVNTSDIRDALEILNEEEQELLAQLIATESADEADHLVGFFDDETPWQTRALDRVDELVLKEIAQTEDLAFALELASRASEGSLARATAFKKALELCRGEEDLRSLLGEMEQWGERRRELIYPVIRKLAPHFLKV